MIFIVIVIISLIISYLVITSGVLHYLSTPNDFKEISNTLFDGEDEIEPGMFGSEPSDKIDSYDSKKIINIPLSTNINLLLDSYQHHANIVFSDFENNENSKSWKHYKYDEYKIGFLNRNKALTQKQLNDYYKITNTVIKRLRNLVFNRVQE